LKDILRGQGMTAVFVTHDQEEAARIGDRILVLADGSIAQEGTARDIFYQPRTEFVARFVGVDNIYRGEVALSEDGLISVSVDGAMLEVVSPVNVGEEVMLGVRPEDVTLVPVGATGSPSSSRNAFTGTVTSLELSGPLVRVSVRCPFPLEALITRRSHEELGIEIGDEVGVRFKATAVVVIE
jgi:molybdopterin-binding protein